VRVLVVTNVYPSREHPASGAFVAEQVRGLEELGVGVRLVQVARRERGVGVYARLRGVIAGEVAAWRPDLVHVRYGGVMAEVATRAVSGVPVLVTFCGTDLLGSPAEPLSRRLTIAYGVRASKKAARRSAGIVVVSENLLAALPDDVDRDRVWLLPDPVDLDVFRPLDRGSCRAQLGWDAQRRHILFPSSRARAEKRFPLAAAAVATLAREGVPVELHFLEAVPHGEVPVWLNASDAVVLTSTHEGSPNAVKEALACEIPVVSVDVGDVASLLQGIDGCHLAVADPSDIAEKLRRVLDGAGRVAGRARADEVSLGRNAARLLEIYEMLVGRST